MRWRDANPSLDAEKQHNPPRSLGRLTGGNPDAKLSPHGLTGPSSKAGRFQAGFIMRILDQRAISKSSSFS